MDNLMIQGNQKQINPNSEISTVLEWVLPGLLSRGKCARLSIRMLGGPSSSKTGMKTCLFATNASLWRFRNSINKPDHQKDTVGSADFRLLEYLGAGKNHDLRLGVAFMTSAERSLSDIRTRFWDASISIFLHIHQVPFPRQTKNIAC